jgi:hypothetical protein
LGVGTELVVGGSWGSMFWLAYGWLFLNPKQFPIQPKNPSLGTAVLGVAPAYVGLGAICAEVNPTITNVKAAITANAITIFVLFILFYHHIIIWSWRLMAVG